MKLLAPALLVPLALFVASCGEDESELCSSLKSLKGSVQQLEDVNLREGDSVDELDQALDAVNEDLVDVRSAAEQELGGEYAALEASVDELGSAAERVAGTEEIDEQALRALVAAVASVDSDYRALEEAAPDCDL